MKPLQKQIDELKERVRRLESDIKPVQDHTWTKIGDLEWSENLGLMNWEEAKKKCEEMGGRLPTRIELIDLYDNHYNECQKLIASDEGSYFWSATGYSSTNAYSVSLIDGSTYSFSKYSFTTCVRCVREVKKTMTKPMTSNNSTKREILCGKCDKPMKNLGNVSGFIYTSYPEQWDDVYICDNCKTKRTIRE